MAAKELPDSDLDEIESVALTAGALYRRLLAQKMSPRGASLFTHEEAVGLTASALHGALAELL